MRRPWERGVLAVVYRILHNCAIDTQRKRSRLEFGPDPPEPIAQDGLSPLDAMVDEENQDRIEKWVSTNKSADINITALRHHIDDPSMTTNDLAQRLDCPKVTASKRLSRGRAKLKEFLTDEPRSSRLGEVDNHE